MANSDLGNRIVGQLTIMLTERVLRELTREIVAPLVERANVSETLKRRALAPQDATVEPGELPGTPEERDAAVAELVMAGGVALNDKGHYYTPRNIADPGPGEVLKALVDILEGWPEDEAEKIRAPFRNGDDGGSGEE